MNNENHEIENGNENKTSSLPVEKKNLGENEKGNLSALNVEPPKESQASTAFKWSPETSPEFKYHNCGFEKGREVGFSEGLGHGRAQGVVAGISIVGAGILTLFLSSRNKK